jgi:WXG100 family type VII secretion target
MDEITVSPDEMRGIASEFNSLQNEMTEYISEGNSITSTLQDTWQSDAADKFSEDWDAIANDSLPMVVELLEVIAERLNTTADIYEETDSSMA